MNSFLLFFISIPFISSILLKINGASDNYCFVRDVYIKSDVKFSYAVSSEHKENINVVMMVNEKVLFNKTHEKEELSNSTTQSGSLRTELQSGRVKVCFTPGEHNEYFVSFDLDCDAGGEYPKDLATDGNMKEVLSQVKKVKETFDELETKLKYTADGKYNHLQILYGIISSIKFLTTLKIGMYFLLSVIQVIVIIKFFGPDKRVKKVEGAFKDGL